MSSSSPKTVIRLRGATKTFASGRHSVTALRGVDLDVPAGAMLALAGPGGSGKSTLVDLLAGLHAADEGEVAVLGHHLAARRPADRAALRLRRIGLVRPDPGLLADLSLGENTALPLEAAGIPRARARQAARAALDRVGIADLRDRLPAQVDPAARQRAAVARAVVGDRELLLADDPTARLDSRAAADLLRLLAGLRDHGVTVVLTHRGTGPGPVRHADLVAELADGVLGPVTTGGRP
ncbi:ATP-binding cassette domain-containing protein [Streptomyces sp. BI20]|uniref:ATP-binding cassette domain-containing protein n=1 Tax=Streptomyces sp. BI20 TaxID=3403460 RepID=UPI003C78EDA5